MISDGQYEGDNGVNMHELVMAISAGFLVGIVFTFLKLPLPAPPVLPGIVGILGVYLGGKAFVFFSKYAGTIFSAFHR
jgi:XapX domain-containing protein